MSHQRALSKLGGEVAEELDNMADPTVLADVRSRLVRKVEPRPTRRNWSKPVLMVAPLAAAAAIAAFVMTRGDHSDIAFDVGNPPQAGAVGTWTTAPSDRSVPIQFADGSQIDVHPNARTRVAASTEEEVWVLHESGTLSATVLGGEDGAQYRITAGDFDVTTHRARLELRWDPDARWLDVYVSSGSVKVRTPHSSEAIPASAGQRIQVSAGGAQLEISSGAPSATVVPPEVTGGPATSTEPSASSSPPAPPASNQ